VNRWQLPSWWGLELDEFSMSPPMIPLAKQILRNLDAEEMKALAARALEMEDPQQIKAFVKESIPLIAEISG